MPRAQALPFQIMPLHDGINMTYCHKQLNKVMEVKKVCCVDGCSRAGQMRRGMCEAHYRRWKKSGTANVEKPLKAARGEPERFLQKVILSDTEECIFWPHSRHYTGYGQVFVNSKNCNAAREACKIAHGNPPSPQHHAAHKCGNGHLGCVNPRHLIWATPEENNAHKKEHGTYLQGERIPTSKLKAENVAFIRQNAGKITQSKLAQMFETTQSNISFIQNGKRWASVMLPEYDL